MSCWKVNVCGKDLCGCKCGDGRVDLGGEACGFPPKTIRAIIAFLVIGVTFVAFVGAGAVFAVDGQYKLLMGIITAMTNIASASLGYYFGHRGVTNHPSVIPDTKSYASRSRELSDVATCDSCEDDPEK